MSIFKNTIKGLITAGLILSFSAISNLYANDLEITGFVDGAYVSDPNAQTASFGLDKVVIYTSKKLSDTVSIYTDLGFYAGKITVYVDPASSLKEDEVFSLNVDQAFFKLSNHFGAGLDITFGKFDAPIGFELVDAPDMFQYSHSLVFDYGIAGFHTGLMVDKSFGMIDGKIYLVNGWDNNTDNNEAKTIGGRLGVNLVEGLNIGLSGVSGAEKPDNNSEKRTVFDVDLTYTAIENLTIGAEFNSGTEDNGAATEDKWTGFLLMAHFDFLDNLGLTLRVDRFDDSETGSRLKLPTTQQLFIPTTQQSITAALTFGLADNLGGLVEIRQDSLDDMLFTDKDGPTDSNNTVAVEFTGTF